MTKPKFFIEFILNISFNVKTVVVAFIPVAFFISLHKISSLSNPNQLAEVPFHAITLTFASANSFADSIIFE